MTFLSSTFRFGRALVAFALLFSAGAPLMQYACGVTGETLTASALSAEASEPDAVSCGAVSEGVHDRLCEPSPVPGCEGKACTTDTVETQSVAQPQTSSPRIASVLTAGALPSQGSVALHSTAPLRSTPDAGLNTWDSHHISVRFRTLSFRL